METALPGLAAILVLGVGAQWLAWRLRTPSILLLLLAGLLAGPGARFINPDHSLDPDALLGALLLPAVSVSVALILFEGGLSLRLADIDRLGGVVRNLVTVGALVTWCVAAAAAHWILGLGPKTAVLLGAILIVTGPTVIGPLLRHVRPLGRVGPVLRWEGIVIDPIGATIAVLVFHAISFGSIHQAAPAVLWIVLKTVLTGSGIGASAAGLLVLVLRRFWVPDYLQNPVSLATVVAAFVVSEHIQDDSGLFTAVVMGVVLANQRDVHIRHIVEFKENLSLLLVSGLFIMLAARLRWVQLAHISGRSVLFAAVLILVARPLSVAICTWRSGMTIRERLFLAWMAPRGIVAASVSSVFALRLRGTIPEADLLVSETFLVIILTVIVYASTARFVARRLGLAPTGAQGFLIAGGHPFARALAEALHKANIPLLVVDTNRENVRLARLAGLPVHAASILSEQVMRRVEFSGISRLLALTPNDEVNALASVHFGRLFGRSEAYQLAPADVPSGPKQKVASELRGRVLFGPEVTWDYINRRLREGAVIRSTLLTETFGYPEFLRDHSPGVVPLFLADPTGEIVVFTADTEVTPAAGQTLIGLVDPRLATRKIMPETYPAADPLQPAPATA